MESSIFFVFGPFGWLIALVDAREAALTHLSKHTLAMSISFFPSSARAFFTSVAQRPAPNAPETG